LDKIDAGKTKQMPSRGKVVESKFQ